MKPFDKVQLSPNAPLTLKCTYGTASVLTVTGVVAGVVFVRHDWTHQEFMVSEDEVQLMAPDDAVIQGQIYLAHIEQIRERTAKSK